MEHGAIRRSIAGAAIAEADRRRLREPASKRLAAGAGAFGVVNSDRDVEALAGHSWLATNSASRCSHSPQGPGVGPGWVILAPAYMACAFRGYSSRIQILKGLPHLGVEALVMYDPQAHDLGAADVACRLLPVSCATCVPHGSHASRQVRMFVRFLDAPGLVAETLPLEGARSDMATGTLLRSDDVRQPPGLSGGTVDECGPVDADCQRESVGDCLHDGG